MDMGGPKPSYLIIVPVAKCGYISKQRFLPNASAIGRTTNWPNCITRRRSESRDITLWFTRSAISPVFLHCGGREVVFVPQILVVFNNTAYDVEQRFSLHFAGKGLYPGPIDSNVSLLHLEQKGTWLYRVTFS